MNNKFKLLEANNCLENDLNSLHIFFNDHKFGHLLWACTYRGLRADDIVGLIEEYYDNVQNNDNLKIKEFLAPLKILIPYFKGLISHTNFESTSESIWICTGVSEKKHRYKDLLNHFKDKYGLFSFRKEFSSDVIVSETKSLNFSKLAKFYDAPQAFKIALLLKKYSSKIKDSNKTASRIKNIPWTHFFNMALKEIWIKRAFKIQKPKGILYSTANTFPSARLISRLAKLNKVPFIIVACRPMFVNTRIEERACKIDLEEINDARIADFWIVWDKYSKITLKNCGIPEEKIFISQKPEKINNPKIINGDYILLFTHDVKQNDLLISAWVDVLNKINLIFSIRTHPNCKLNEDQLNQLSPYKYEDISEFPLFFYDFKNVIAVSVNSTSAVEVVGLGGGVIWLPFLNDRSVIFEPIFEILGRRMISVKDLYNTVNYFKVNNLRNDFISNCLDSYDRNFKSVDQIELFISEFNKITK